jgi:delta-1-pyrroline-5-carboxylate synthetase
MMTLFLALRLKVKSAAWALDRGVCVVICNGMQDNAIKTILHGRRIGTFFTGSGSGGEHATTDVLAENGKVEEHVVF